MLETRQLSEIIWCHYMIHQVCLCTEALGVGFNDVMLPKPSFLQRFHSCLFIESQFNQLTEEIDANYKDVLYFSQVHWLKAETSKIVGLKI